MKERDWTDRVTAGDPTTLAEYYLMCMRAENLAQREHGCEFEGLPADIQDKVWEEANHSPTKS